MSKFLSLLAAFCLLSQGTMAAEPTSRSGQTLSLFLISKDDNGNRLYYEATVTPDCRFDRKKPIQYYWVMEDGSREGLNYFEKDAFPVEVREKSADVIIGDIRALKEKNVDFPITIQLSDESGRCEAIASSPKLSRILSVHLADIKMYEPRKITVQGLDQSGQPTELTLVNTSKKK